MPPPALNRPPPRLVTNTAPSDGQQPLSTVEERDPVYLPRTSDTLRSSADRPQEQHPPSLQEEHQEQERQPHAHTRDSKPASEQRIPHISHTPERSGIDDTAAESTAPVDSNSNHHNYIDNNDNALPQPDSAAAAAWEKLEKLIRQSFVETTTDTEKHKDKDQNQERNRNQYQDSSNNGQDEDHVFDFPIRSKAAPYPSPSFSNLAPRPLTFTTTPPQPPSPPPAVEPPLAPAPSLYFNQPPEEGDSAENEVLAWVIYLIATTFLLYTCVSLIRSCTRKPWFASIMGAEYSTLHGQGGQGPQGAGGHYRGGPGSGPLQVAADEEANQELTPDELEALMAGMTDAERQSFEAARVFQAANPPCSVPTDISLSQYLSIQEKGVSAWEFEPSYDHRLLVHDRTELSFFDREAGVQTNLPLPKQQEVYYWEVKMFEKSPNTTVAVGVSTKPYPTTRLPGWNRHSVAYFSNGLKYYNAPWSGMSYGPPMYEGDVVGCGYRPRTGTVFFTRNGKRLEDAYTGLRYNLFPTVGATGPCVLHVNFGQSGFVFVEANVKKWGLAPATGSLVPPPAYGSELGSILLEAGTTSSPGMVNNNNNMPRRPPLRTSQSRARVQAAGILVQIDGSDSDSHHERNGGGGGGGGGGAGGVAAAGVAMLQGRYGTPPVDISLSDISAPPPKYTSLDQHGESQSRLASATVAPARSSSSSVSSSSSASSASSPPNASPSAVAAAVRSSSTGGQSAPAGTRGRSESRASRATTATNNNNQSGHGSEEDDDVTLLVDARPTTMAQNGAHGR
ncbi:Rsp5p-dependent ubiquitination, sorting of cargo proteins at the multivesicular body [Actinomortierella ambigua]|uniref:Rsp5p-dependent ubiquitination, sorting of cargo proteins at the multivesicular body n=1 Tax=Actinomortierella ambigua TaxID=1343610 RepID=A0A9P6PLU4_9FUNG|nr:Rsp5p-dependent ubiquitination, sorting of cargo proteins at the multivesicular body [Actinomortierella ambigua]